jgi:hypothetical protein
MGRIRGKFGRNIRKGGGRWRAVIFGKAAEDGGKIDWSGFFEPLTDLAAELLGDLTGYFTEIGAALPEALEGIDWTGFTNAIDDLVNTGKDLLGQLLGGLDLTKAEDLEKAIQKVVDAFESWVKLTEGIVVGLGPFLVKITELVNKFIEMDDETLRSGGIFLGWSKAINTVANLIPNLTGALNILSGSIGILSLTRLPGMVTALGSAGLGGALLGLVGTGGALTLFAAAIALIPDTELNTWLRDNSEAFDKLAGSVENAWLKMRGIDTTQIDNLKTSGDQKKLLGELAVAVNDWANRLNEVPGEVSTTIEADLEEAFGDLDFYSKTLDELSGTVVETPVKLALTEFFEDIDKAEAALYPFADKELTKRINLDLDEFFGEVDAASEKLDKDLASEKLIEIKIQGEIDIELEKIRTQATSSLKKLEHKQKLCKPFSSGRRKLRLPILKREPRSLSQSQNLQGRHGSQPEM